MNIWNILRAICKTTWMNYWNMYDLENETQQEYKPIISFHALGGSRLRSLSNFLHHVVKDEDDLKKPNYREEGSGGRGDKYLKGLTWSWNSCSECWKITCPRPRWWHACVHAFVFFLSFQFKWNNSHHISQVKDFWNFNSVQLIHNYIS